MSVPRPAILVAKVIAPFCPALAITVASFSLFLALSIWYGNFASSNADANNSFLTIDPDPTSTGRPAS